MELTQEHRNLIENIIRSNHRFSGNEDMFEDFCSETFKRSYRIISSINNINHLESYLNKVATSAILEVLKTSGRLRRSTEGYVKTNEIPVSNTGIYDMDTYGDLLYDIPDPAPHVEEKIIDKDNLNRIMEILISINNQEKNKAYLELFNLRYIKSLKQKQIAEEMNISQGEVSKRLIELASKINYEFSKD